MSTMYKNLDDVTSSNQRSFVYKGKEYFMSELSVGAMIELQKRAVSLEQAQKDPENTTPESLQEVFETMVDQVCAAFETFPRELCLKLTPDQLFDVFEVMTAQPDDDGNEPEKK